MNEAKEEVKKEVKERIPNGDISTPLKNFEKELKALIIKGKDSDLSLTDKARFIAVAKEFTDAIDYYTTAWGNEIKKLEAFKEDFVDLGKSVYLREGASMSEINNAAMDEMNLAEIKQAAKLTEKGLKDAGRADLISKYKVIIGKKASSLVVSALK